MKKIFAIALALVMVLSMASAFAWCPTGFDWNCTTTVCANGKGSVELVPYVKGNGCDKGNTWSANTCAGAVNGDLVYAAVKVTVDADPNLDWWNFATLKLETKGVKELKSGEVAIPGGATSYEFTAGDVAKFIAKLDTDGKLKAGEYYLYAVAGDWKAVKAADFVAGADTLFSAKVDEAAKVKFCATLASKFELGSVTINNKYNVYYENGNLKVVDVKDNTKFATFNVVDEKVKTITYSVNGTAYTLVAFDGQFLDTAGNKYGTSCEPWTWLYDMMTYFGINFGTCINKDTVNANLGWNDKTEKCITWSKDVVSVVNTECVVAIPKTGDASVLAWLF